ncbi:MAG: hypothetical protein AB1700_16625 [Bacillota bacterium]
MKLIRFGALLAIVLMSLPRSAFAKSPDCAGPDRWPTNMALVQLKNAGIADSGQIDFSKTRSTRIVSERIGKDLYRQVHRVIFSKKNGDRIELMTVSDASHDECSMGAVQVFLISKQLGGE